MPIETFKDPLTDPMNGDLWTFFHKEEFFKSKEQKKQKNVKATDNSFHPNEISSIVDLQTLVVPQLDAETFFWL